MSDRETWIGKVMGNLRAIPSPLKNEADEDAFREALSGLHHPPEDELIDAIAIDATAEIARVVDATVGQADGGDFDSGVLYALKQMAWIGLPEGIDCILRTIRKGYASDNWFWTIVFNPIGSGHPEADRVFAALADPLPNDFLAIALLDTANEAGREGNLKQHPFDSGTGVARLREYLTGDTESYAHSACGALPFIQHSDRDSLLDIARQHTDEGVRIEAAWVMAKLGRQEGFGAIAQMCLDPNRAVQAMHYLDELGREDLIPKAAREPDFAAMAQMCNWLQHPNEFGEPPDAIELLDKRMIYWPPTGDTREMHIFKYRYEPNDDWREEPDEGVGLVGSITFALFDETDPGMDPKDIYGRHCCWELRMEDDTRVPEDSENDAELGWRLIEEGAP